MKGLTFRMDIKFFLNKKFKSNLKKINNIFYEY